jgi:putative flippase GtrA
MIKRELAYFAINGSISVIIAYIVYIGLVRFGISMEWSNGIAYLAGMLYGFFGNKKLTFQDQGSANPVKVASYSALHMSTLFLNVHVNSIMLGHSQGVDNSITFSFLTAIAVSTIVNFIGLRYWVFRPRTYRLRNAGSRGKLS